jgi:hypothetical protein
MTAGVVLIFQLTEGCEAVWAADSFFHAWGHTAIDQAECLLNAWLHALKNLSLHKTRSRRRCQASSGIQK